MLYQKNNKNNDLEEVPGEFIGIKRHFALKREKITNVVSGLISETEEAEVDPHMLDDYERLKSKCDEIISKIKNRKIKKPRRKEKNQT